LRDISGSFSSDGHGFVERLREPWCFSTLPPQALANFIHFPITYYFHSFDERSSLPSAIPHLARFAETGARPGCDGKVRLTATSLRAALDDLAELLQTRYIRIESKDAGDVFKAFAEYRCPLNEAR
jgi:hypothetical protein